MSIKQEMVGGVFWTAINKYSSIIIQLIITSILARLISPEEFGVVAIAQVIIVFLGIFSQMGFGPAIIQNKTLSQYDLSSIFSVSVLLGVAFSLLFCFSSSIIASYYDQPSLSGISKWLSLGLFFNTINVVPGYLFFKDKRFKILAKRNVFIQIISGVASIIYALGGGGCYALVLSVVSSSLLSFLVSVYYYPIKINLKVDLKPVKKIFSFSAFQFLFTLINFFARNLDKLIIGKYLSMQQLGYYQKSYALMMQPLDKVSDVITPVIQPILSEYQNQYEVIADKYTKLIRVISLISFPIGIILFACGDEIIKIIFGSQWDAAIPCFKILTLSLPLQMMCTTTGSIYQSCNNTKMMFWSGVATSLFTVSGFFVASYYYQTIEAIAVSWNISMVFAFVVNFILLYKVVFSSPLIRFITILIHPFVLFFLLAVFYHFVSPVINYTVWINLFLKGGLGIVISLLYLSVFKQIDLMGILKQIKTYAKC